VVITGRREQALTSAASGIQERTGAKVDWLVSDIADPQAAQAALREVELRHGRLDVLVLNSGGPPRGRILELPDERWYAAFELLVMGPLRLARLALPAMAERGFGRIVLVTSTAVRRPEPDLAASSVLRSAATAAAKLLALEFAAQGVTVNCVAPGATATPRRHEVLSARADATGRGYAELDAEDVARVPARRAADPAEVGAAVAFLASDAAGYVNGSVLTVDGGRTEMVW
jgi:3-oxoacyl-[acyl-carrier protein] reductase